MGIIQEELARLREENNPFYRNDSGLEYMSDMDHWVCVHVTKYEPKPNPEADGALCIQTTAMATGYKLPRPTVHVTLNQVVGNHGYGNWDAALIVVLVPYNDVVRQNGNPQEISVDDTYFVPDPDKGLVLPDSAYIIKPNSNSGKLFEIGEHGATYKTEGYTQEEIDEILSLSNYSRAEYEELLRGNFSEQHIEALLGYDEKFIKLYKEAKDKKAFIHGLMEEARYEILNQLLRNAVVEMALEKMGYHHVFAHEDEISGKVAQVAMDAGISGNSGNKGHSFSIEHDLESEGCMLAYLSDLLKSKNISKIEDYLRTSMNPVRKDVIASILSGEPVPDVYRVFTQTFDEKIASRKSCYEIDEKYNEVDEATKQRRREEIKELEEGGIKGYNSRIDTVLHRHARRMTLEINQALNELRKNPKDFAMLQRAFKNDEEFDQLVEQAGNTLDLSDYMKPSPGGKDDR